MASRNGEKILAFDGRGAHFLDYDPQVRLWMRTARAKVPSRASFFALRTQRVPRQKCLVEGSNILGHSDGVAKILNIPRNYFVPEAVDALRRQVMRFSRFRRTAQSDDVYIAEYAPLRRKAEPEIEMGAGAPEQFASILRVDNTALSRQEKSLVLASCHKSLRFDDASASMRRLFGSRGSGGRQDALLT